MKNIAIMKNITSGSKSQFVNRNHLAQSSQPLARRSQSYIVSLLLLFFFSSVAWGQETKTVADGSSTHQHVPLDFYNTDAKGYNRAQMLYPASLLSDMNGASISSVTFYHQQTSGNTVNKTLSQPWYIKIGETTSPNLSSGFSSATLTQVYSANLVVANGVFSFTFSDNYTYNGGNLIVEISTTGNTGNWLGSSNQGCLGVDNIGSTYTDNYYNGSYDGYTAFLPKTTFTYTPAPKPTPVISQSSTNFCTSNVTLTASLEQGVEFPDGFEYHWYSDAGCTNEISGAFGSNYNQITIAPSADLTDIYCRLEKSETVVTQVPTEYSTPNSDDDDNKYYTYTVPENTVSLKLEVWGAQGGSYSSTYSGGKGGYSTGILESPAAGSNLYVVVGGQPAAYTNPPASNVGTRIDGGYNGGGSTMVHYYSSNWTLGQGGGGATHIANESPSSGDDYQLQYYSSTSDQQKILLVAGGGSGSVYFYNGGSSGFSGYAGGGSTSEAHNDTYRATQTGAGQGGAFGKGADYLPTYTNYKYAPAGGGGGWYGGGNYNNHSDTYNADLVHGHGGGSGYVNTSLLSASPAPQTIAGNLSIPTHDGTSTMTGNSGHGYARITANVETIEVTAYPAGTLQVRCNSCNPANIAFSNSSTVNLYVGQSVSPTRTATSSNSSGAITYSSDNSAVSVNSSTGYVTALRGGTATVSATVAQYGDYCSNSASYTVNVQWPTVSLNQSSTPLCGEEVTISASISPDVNLANQYEFAWYTSDDFANEHRIDPSLTYGNNGRNLTYTASSGTEIYCRLERMINSELFYSDDASLEISCFECSDPTDLAQTSYSTNSAVLEWVETGDADEWVLQYSTDPDFLSDIHSVEVSGSPTTTLSGLTPETIYYCRVKSLCIDDEETGWSNVCEATPTICKLVTGSGETTNTYLPSYSYYKYSLTQQIYTSAEVGEAGQIKGISFYCTQNGSRTFDIYIKHIDNKSTFSSTTDWITVTNADKVFSGDVTFTAGTWTKINFQIPFDYDGNNNIVVVMDDNSGVYSSPYLYYNVYSATNMALRIYSDGTNYDALSPSSYTGTLMNVKNQIMFCVGPVVSCHNPRTITNNVTKDNLTGIISATITWTGGDSAESEYSIDGGTTWTYINGRQVTLSPLDANTLYTVQVRTYCSSSDKSEHISTVFRTPCGSQVVPYTENFEGVSTGNSGVYEVPPCWEKYAISNTNYPYVAYNTGGNAHSGSKYLYMYPASGADNIVTLPTMLDPINTLQISFWAKSSTDQKKIQLGYVKNGTFTGLEGDKYNFTLTTTYQQFFAYLDDVPAGADIIAIRAYYQSASYYVYLDDIEVSLMPTCFTPTDVTASNINTTSATISWTAGRNETAWNLRYRRVGAGSWTYVNDISDVSSCDLSGLTEATHYEVQVRSDCGGDDYSDWTSTFSFATAYTIPFVENFPTTTIPADWSRYTGLLANVMNGTANLTATTSGWTGSTSYAFNSSPHFYAYIYGTTANYWMVTPLVHMESNVELSFDYALTNTSGGAAATTGTDDKFVVLVSTDNGANWTILRQYDNAGSAYTYNSLATAGKATISLGSYAGQNVLVAFYGESTTSNASNYMHIDNVKMAQPCDAPSDIQASNITSRSATISWLPGDGSAWQYSYNHSTWYDINSNAITTSGIRKSFNLLGLGAGQSYTVYLRTNCTIEQSDYVSVSFNTDFCDESDKCILSYVLGDQNSDGWDGNAYIAVVDHETSWELARWTVSSGANARGTDSVCNYRYVDFVWHKGTYDRECSFDIYNADGVLILSASTGDANNYTDNQVLLSYQMNCPSCLRPTSLSVSKVTNSSARLTWTPGGSEEHWRYSIDGTNWTTFADGDITVSGSNRMATISGLSAGETYTVYLQAVCGGEDYSASNIVEFSTLTCLPYQTCDISYTLTDSYGDTWNGNAIQVVDVSTDNVLITLTNDYNLYSVFGYSQPCTQQGSFSVCEDSPVKFVWVEGEYADEVSYEFSDASGVFYSVATNVANSFADGDELEIDDGVYEYTVVCPNCRRPVNLEASNITDNSATIGWIRDADSYNVNYGMVYNFDDGTPLGWTTIDGGDPLEYGWGVASARNASAIGRNSSDCMVSQSYDNNYGSITPDNYLVSPRITFTAGTSISFYAMGLDVSAFAEHFEVAVSSTGTSGFISVSETFEATNDWTLYTVDLSAYSGQQGYVAIHHFDCSDQYWLAVDDIAITKTVSVTTNPYTLTGLTPSTGYMVSVQLACEEDEYSTWSDAEEFTTSAPPYAAQWVSAEMNTSDWCFGDTRDVTLRIKNTGPTTWKKNVATGGDDTSTPTDHDVIAVSYKWEGDLDYSTTYAEFTSDVANNQTGTVNLTVNKPTRAGLNRLLFNIKRMNVGWFSDFNYAVEKAVIINAPIPSLALGNTNDLATCLDGSKQIKIVANQQSGSFFEEFETNLNNWTTSYTVSSNYRWLQREGTELGSHTSAYSGSYNAAAVYNGSATSYAYMQLNRDLSSYTDKVMSFWYKNPYGSTYSNYDYLYVETSTNGSSWTQLASYTDYHNSWTHVTNLTIPDNVKYIRFSAYIRGANYGRGVAIDDVSLTYTDNSSSAFTWTPSTGSTAGTVDPHHGNIYVVTPSAQHNTYTVSSGGCSSSITIDVMPTTAPTVSITDNGTPNTIDCGTEAELTASGADAAAFYNWYNSESELLLHNSETFTTAQALNDNTTFLVDASFEGVFNTIVYDTAGSYSLAIPDGVTSVLIEAWGAQGGGSHENAILYQDRGGRGGYSKGTYTVSGGETLYICVGGRGKDGIINNTSATPNATGGYNGGGSGAPDGHDDETGGGGGGATHVAISTPSANNPVGYQLRYYDNNRSDVLLVAGGGGGSSCQAPGGCGGGATGGNAKYGSVIGSWQNGTSSDYVGLGGPAATSGSGNFGYGEDGVEIHNNGSGGGGGGYYGGYRATADIDGRRNSGGGGSGYVNTTKLTDVQTIDGENEMPNPGGGYMVGKKDGGYVKITMYGTQVCKSAQRTVEVAVNKPSLTMGSISSETVCAGTPFTALDITPSSNNGSLTYTWQKDSGDPYIGTSTISTPTAGVYNVTVTSNINACEATATASATLTLNTPSVGTLSFTENKTICPGSEVTLKVTSETSPTGTLEYRWYKDNVEMGGETDNHISTREAGTYKVSVMAKNTIGTVTCPASQVHDNIEVSYLTPSDPDITAMNIGGSIPSGSVLWTGQGTNWNDDYNWMSYNGSTYTLTATPNGSNVLIGKYSTCVTGTPTLNVNTTANVNNLTIASGTTLKVPANKILNIAGNLSNVGTLSAYNALDGTGGTVVFNGNSNQTISNAVTFRDVEFAQNGVSVDTIKAANNIIVNGTATFTKGIVKANMLFDSGASSADASMSSYVDGTVTKNGDGSSFTFPTGSDGVLGTITATIRSGQNANAKFHHKATGFDQEHDGYPRWWNVADMCGGDPFNHISNFEYWDFNSSENLSEVTFVSKASSADAHFHDPSEYPDPSDGDVIQVAVHNGTCWSNSGGHLVMSDNNKTITISGVAASRSTRGSAITSFGSKDPTVVLPIELLSFSATCNGRYAELEWSTASERNNDYFVIERSEDAINFTEIARVAGAGNSIEPIDYAYNDYGIHGGDNYYRLVQVDYDGTRTVSEVIVANCIEPESDGDPDVLAYPNPFNGELTLVLDNFSNRAAIIEVYDMLGKLIYTEKASAPQNSYETILNLSNLPSGAYTVRVSTTDFVINKNVVKN